MPTYLPKNYSSISTLCNIASQYGQQTLYNYEQVDILEASLEFLNSESLEAESVRSQLESAKHQASQTASAEVVALARLRAAVDELIPSE
jgi:hypothetical protein